MTADRLERHRARLWRLAYSMLGVAADADDVVQETFLRALGHLPDDERPPEPWLVQVAMNLSRDRLRARRRSRYAGPWLPTPLSDQAWSPLVATAPSPDVGLERAEDLGFGFVLALERTTPSQRAVLALRDVLGCSTAEVASILGMSETNVKVTLHRARRAVAAAGPAPGAPDPDVMALLSRCLVAMAAGDARTVAACLAPDVVVLDDGGGETFAARVPVVGPERVAKLYCRLASFQPGSDVAVGLAGGLPALSVVAPPGSRWPSAVLLFDVRAGRIHRIWSVSAPRKVGPRL